MRQFGKKILQHILRRFARSVLRRYHPEIVAVTGSVGKTTTVQACALVLAGSRPLRASEKNYNNELGVPLSILGASSGGRSLLRWARVMRRALRLIFGPDTGYPEVLVLELGADKPGDIGYLVEWLKPQVGVVTSASATHLENFSGISAVAEEKGRLPRSLSRGALAVLNADEPLVLGMRLRTAAGVLTYGLGPHADVSGSAVQFACQLPASAPPVCNGTQCTVRFRDQTATLSLPHVLGSQLLYPALAAIAVGTRYGVTLAEAARRLREFVPPPGRMRLVAGIKGIAIIDDSYNSSPQAAQAAVRVFALMPAAGGRKFAVLGDMLELGSIAGRAHRELGGQVARVKIHALVCVGELARDIGRGAVLAGMPEELVYTFADARSAGRFLQDRIHPRDLLLVKGSQGVRLERVVKELMAEPERAGELLVRQGPDWE